MQLGYDISEMSLCKLTISYLLEAPEDFFPWRSVTSSLLAVTLKQSSL